MRRSEKIQRFLKQHPRVSEAELQKKFDVSWREAQQILRTHCGIVDVMPNSLTFCERVFGCMRDVFSSQQKTIFVLIGVATLVRLGYIAFLARYEILRLPILDAEYYVEWATNIIQHGWLGERIFFTEPLYAYLLALFLKIFGEHTWLPAMLGLQFVLGALFPVLLFAVGTKLFSRSIGIVAGLIAALYGPFVFYDGLLLKTSLEVYSIPLFLLVFWHAMEHPKTRTFVFAGLMLGVIALIKGNVLIFVPLACLFIFFFLEPFVLQRRLLFIGAFVMGVIACIAPITLRNYLVGQDIVPTNYSIGLVLYQGNWWGGDGSTARVPSFLRPHPKYEERDAVGMAESYQGHVLKPSEVSRFWMSKTLAEITDAPNHFLATLWHKVLLLLNYREYSDNYSYAFYRSYIPFLWILPGYFFVILCGGVGLVLLFFKHFEAMIVNAHALAMKEQALARFRRTRRMLFWFFIAYIGVLLLTTINSRYRMPLVPFLIVFSASAIVFCAHCWYERTAQSVGKILFVLVILLGVTLLPLSLFKRVSFADAYHNVGYWYFEAQDYAQAGAYFQKAIAEDDEYAWSYKMLAQIAFLEGRLSDGEKLLKKLIMIRPDDLNTYEEVHLLKTIQGLPPVEARAAVEQWVAKKDADMPYDADFYEASRMLATKNDTEAETALLHSLQKHAHPIHTLITLASLKSKQEEFSPARQYLREALKQNPDLFPARYNLANIYIKENNYTEVADLLAPVYAFVPELGETWYNYAVALIKIGKTGEAVPVAQAYVEWYKDDPARKDKVKKFQDALRPDDASLGERIKNMQKQ